MIGYRQETLRFARGDVERLAEAQWGETGDPGLVCAPNWEMYEAIERARCLVLIVARQDDRAIGYLAGSVYPHPNARPHKIGSLPTYYAEPRRGRGLVLRSLLRHGIALCFEKGACKVMIATSWDHPAGRIIEALGGTPRAIEYSIASAAMPTRREVVHA